MRTIKRSIKTKKIIYLEPEIAKQLEDFVKKCDNEEINESTVFEVVLKAFFDDVEEMNYLFPIDEDYNEEANLPLVSAITPLLEEGAYGVDALVKKVRNKCREIGLVRTRQGKEIKNANTKSLIRNILSDIRWAQRDPKGYTSTRKWLGYKVIEKDDGWIQIKKLNK